MVASAKLWIVSARSATLPDKTTTTICITAGDEQHDEGPLYRPDAASGGGDGGVDHAVGMAVRRVIMTVPVAVPMMMAMPVTVCRCEAEPVQNLCPHGVLRDTS